MSNQARQVGLSANQKGWVGLEFSTCQPVVVRPA